jgi:inosine/xanthosine triphosphatase
MADKGYLTPYEVRKRNVEGVLKSLGCRDYEIIRLDNRYDPRLLMPKRRGHLSDVRFIVVSEETQRTAEELNAERVRSGLKPLEVIVIPAVLAYDSLPISTKRIVDGEIDVEGKKDISIGVGSTNTLKVHAVGSVFQKVFHDVKVMIDPVPVTGQTSQPSGKLVSRGAILRAKKSLSGHDYGVGIESGMVEGEHGVFIVHYCAIIDRAMRVTIGHGPGFTCPPEVTSLLKTEGMTIAEACRVAYGIDENTLKQVGTIGVMTKGHFKRDDLIRGAVYAALAPRIHRMSPIIGGGELAFSGEL